MRNAPAGPTMPLLRALALTTLVALSLAMAREAAAQTSLAFSGLKQDTTAPVEVTADSLSVDQAAGTAVFSGNVLVVQGTMRLSAAEVHVAYAKGDTSRIESLRATGGVTLATAAEAAEAAEAVYRPQDGKVVMTGDVLLTQGSNSVSGQQLTVDLNTGTGQMDGRVRTILNTGETSGAPAGGN